MSTTNSEALARLVALTAEGYPFAALQAKITNRRTDVIAPVGAHAPVIKTISDFRRAKKLTPLQLVVVATGREAEETAAALRTLDPQA
jgi:transcription-repair coupling factor (superfamily II helicase)